MADGTYREVRPRPAGHLRDPLGLVARFVLGLPIEPRDPDHEDLAPVLQYDVDGQTLMMLTKGMGPHIPLGKLSIRRIPAPWLKLQKIPEAVEGFTCFLRGALRVARRHPRVA
ncbi:hypothetical protein Aple_065960 [Acrocarpospora pleiomorpha]|uniref:Uncharacterized protein n=1 Tax=Acrocarpospora pleiomorpha TaxID=90975 RepID=A0A5M3XQV3_9ACTN|nr:hypothetical protein Aple_065960 [Acrocarpospora pleiomorpha]